MPAVWHCLAYVGAKPSAAAARDTSIAVPPLVSRDWLKKPVSMREGSFAELEPVQEWMTAKVRIYAPKLLNRSAEEEALMWEKAGMAVERLRIGRDISWGHRLEGGRYLAIAVIAEWATAPPRAPELVQPLKKLPYTTKKD